MVLHCSIQTQETNYFDCLAIHVLNGSNAVKSDLCTFLFRTTINADKLRCLHVALSVKILITVKRLLSVYVNCLFLLNAHKCIALFFSHCFRCLRFAPPDLLIKTRVYDPPVVFSQFVTVIRRSSWELAYSPCEQTTQRL